MLGFLNKIFGNKSDRDIKEIAPLVEKVKTAYTGLSSLSNDQLRAKTIEFKQKIKDHLQSTEAEMVELENELEANPDMVLEEKEGLYSKIDQLKTTLNKKIEEILLEILPDAFAVVKETARRFKENTSIRVTANELDRDLAAGRNTIVIEGNDAVYSNTWLAAGNPVTWDMVHYDVQLIGGVVLHQGKISEMATGEGKTLVGTLPIYLNALAGKGVHIVTVNDYLSRRDSEWNGTIFEFLGLKVDCIDKHEPNSAKRRLAYLADITYGTNNEFGFDYLRDNMAQNPADMVQRGHHYAIVDEVDSVLIDDARTPLIISGPTPKGDVHEFFELKPRVEKLMNAQRTYLNTVLADTRKLFTEKKETEAGLPLLRCYRGLPKSKALIKFLSEPGVRALLQKTENFYMQDQSREMHKVDAELFFVIDEKHNSIELTEKGIDLITASGEDSHFFVIPDVGSAVAEIEKSGLPDNQKLEKKEALLTDFAVKSERIHSLNQLIKSYTLFEKDVEYIIVDGKIKIVDEQTGRVLEGRRYSDGLHQAIEAKENVKVEASTQTYATITLQNYFRMYHKLAGMTGTAETEAGEFWQIYKLDVVVIPTNKPMTRKDEEDLVYKTKREKYNAVIEEISKLTAAGRPVLVGTTSVEISELLSKMLKLRSIRHNVLNAKLHKKEADIVAEAGKSGTVTIATNMAGRGTDIKLTPEVREAGGLAIIGTERHESRRVDRQLRGRSGRQGDPGSSQFFVSLEDDLMRLFGSERIAGLMDRLGLEEGEVIQHSMITKSIERAQKKVEENNFGMRKRLLEYDDVMNSQRNVIYKKRNHALFGNRLSIDLQNMKTDLCESIIQEFKNQDDYEGLKLELFRVFSQEIPFSEDEFKNGKLENLVSKTAAGVEAHYLQKTSILAGKIFPFINDVFLKQAAVYENVVIPFTDGKRGMQVLANLRKSYDSKGMEVIRSFEKTISLAIIDDEWKEHLREMDDLKQSVQNAVYEQKDPLLIYKFESFELFNQVLTKINRDILGFLFKASIPLRTPDDVKEAAAPKKTDMSKLRSDKAEVGSGMPAQRSSQPGQPQAAPKRAEPVRVDPKVGRNDPCPCGSGKKYKSCHGS